MFVRPAVRQFLVRSLAVCQRHIMHMRTIAALPLTALLAWMPTDAAAQASAEVHIFSSDADHVRLVCPAGGDHPAPEVACAALEAAHGDIDAATPLEIVCPEIYDPVWVMAIGRWDGELVFHSSFHANACRAKAASGGIIDLT